MAKKILIVEDEASLAEAIMESLVSEGYEVKVANNGNEAVKKIDDFNPDLILLDIVMPDTDGISFLKQLRKPDSPHAHTKVLIFTNLAGEKKWISDMGLEISDYIVKANSSLAELIEKLKNLL